LPSRKATYADYQARASAFSVGDRVFTMVGGNPAIGGTVVSVWPAIGMVDVQLPYGAVRYPVEDLVIDSSDTFENFTDYQADSVPGGTPTVSVPGGPDPLLKDMREELTDESLMREAADASIAEGSILEVFGKPHEVMGVTRSPEWDLYSFKDGFTLRHTKRGSGGHGSDKLGGDLYKNSKPVGKHLSPADMRKILAGALPGHTASVGRIIEAHVKKALYWDAPDRKYRMSKPEMESGVPSCPRCTGVGLRRVIYKREDGRNEKLHCCPDCLFLIRRGDIIGMGA